MKKNKGLKKFLVGLGIGAGLSALFTTAKGKEIIQDLKKSLDDLLNKVKDIDINDVSKQLTDKINEVKEELEDLDKEKLTKVAKKKADSLKKKTEDLVVLAKEKGTPILEKTAEEVREKTILVIKEVLKKLEKEEK